MWNFIQRLSSPSMNYFLIIHDQEMIMLIFFFYTIDIVNKSFLVCFSNVKPTLPYRTNQTWSCVIIFLNVAGFISWYFVIYVLEQLYWSTSEEKIYMYIFKLYSLMLDILIWEILILWIQCFLLVIEIFTFSIS